MSSKPTPNTTNFLNILKARGLLHQISSEDVFIKLIQQDTPISAYVGTDVTAPSAHLGNLLPQIMLQWWMRCGGKAIVLFGGATTLIGDPSGRDTERPYISKETITQNKKNIEKSFNNFHQNINKKHPQENAVDNLPSLWCDNAEWLGDISYLNFLQTVGTCFTISRMLSFESVKARLDRQQGLSFLEFNYMLMQAYDFWHLFKEHNCLVQMGGSDQWGNIIPGTDLIKHHEKKTGFCITCPLLTKNDGTKMGKTAGGLTLWLDPDLMSPYDFWQHFRNVDDIDVEKFLKMLTFLELSEIAAVIATQDFNKAKILLADTLTSYIHGDEVLKRIHDTIELIFYRNTNNSSSTLSEQELLGLYIPNFYIKEEWITGKTPLAQILTSLKITNSNREARTLMTQGCLMIDEQKITDEKDFTWPEKKTFLIKTGSKNYAIMIKE